MTDAPLRLAVDGSPLLGPRSGVGRYVEGLLTGLAALPGAPAATLAFHPRSGGPPLPPGARLPRRPPGVGLLHRAWNRVGHAPVEMVTGAIDVFHAGNFVLPRLLRAAGVVTVHDLTYLRFPETVDSHVATYRTRVPDSLRRSRRVVTVSAAVREEVCAQYRLDPDRVVVAHNGVDAGWAAARPADHATRRRWGLPERYLLFVGNVEPRKGLPTLVTAHRAARRADPGVPPLVVVGAPGWGDAWAGQPPQAPDVLRLGYLPEDALRSAVAGSTALCLPSRYEGFGLPILEALSCGRPVLASDLPAHREVGGGAVRYLPVGDVDGWAHALLDPGDPEDPVAVAVRRERAAPFTWERSAAVHLDTWRAAAQEAGRTSSGP